MNEFTKYVGLDTHKDTIAVAIADLGRTKPRYYGEIPNTSDAISKLVKAITPSGEVISFSSGKFKKRSLFVLRAFGDVLVSMEVGENCSDRRLLVFPKAGWFARFIPKTVAVEMSHRLLESL